tara:strand:+ start:2546 stop:3058 length:513 start_codon:yes stop_codon:yes gene_type:complete
MFTLQNTTSNATALLSGIIASKIVPVFDMDGVFADASHRQICNADGSLNLDKYREMSTAEHVKKDAELPMIKVLQALTRLGIDFHICTARIMCDNTASWIDAKKIAPKSVMARCGDHDSRRDHKLKTTNLISRFSHFQLKNMMLIDDNLDNCKAAKAIGMKAINVPFVGH